MLRQGHALPGLILALMLAITAGTGAILAFDAFVETRSAPVVAEETISLAALTERITTQLPGVEKIARTPSGKVRVTYHEDGRPGSVFVDPLSGQIIGPDSTSPAMRMITNLHRAWLSGDGGRLAAGLSAGVMLLLSITGLFLLKRLAGGWRGLFRPLAGAGARRWHLELGRLAVVGLLLSSVTAIELSLAGFELVPDGAANEDIFVTASGGQRLSFAKSDGLATLSLADLREITLPDQADATDPITVKTHAGMRWIDAATGLVLREEAHSLAWHIRDLAFRLHTAEGMAWLALLLGLSASGGAALAMTGFATGLRKRLQKGRFSQNNAADAADILVLVGSEGGTTFRFAESLSAALAKADRKVHLAAMNDAPLASPAAQMILLAATAGCGEAPASATHFLGKLAQWQGPKPRVAILGFGDRQFANFCAYADQLESALTGYGFELAMPTGRIDRQSQDAFTAWGQQLAECLRLPLTIEATAASGPLHGFELIAREEYGIEVQAPTAILRFRIVPRYRGIPFSVQHALGLLPHFEAGDLVAITPPGETRARYYSLASSSRSGVLEICVRHQPGGACSSFLYAMQPGDRVDASIRPNPAFRPDGSAGPLILIGAGAGIAPLMGFIRHVGRQRPVHLYWGGRNPHADFLYRDELEAHALDGRLSGWRTIFSRFDRGGYVQDLITQDAVEFRRMIAAGGQILICGSREMASGVRQALDVALAPLGLDFSVLRQTGRLIEDVY